MQVSSNSIETPLSVSPTSYLYSVFNSGFSETSAIISPSIDNPLQSGNTSDNETTFTPDHLHEDSDLDEEAAEAANLDVTGNDDGEEDEHDIDEFQTPLDERSHLHTSPSKTTYPSASSNGGGLMVTTNEPESSDFTLEGQDRDQGSGSDADILRIANLSMIHSGSHQHPNLEDGKREESPETVLVGSMRSERSHATPVVPGPAKVRVVVNDVAYTTYRAVLYYVGFKLLQRSLSNLYYLALHRHNRLCSSCIKFLP
jgi:hypothetical protein